MKQIKQFGIGLFIGLMMIGSASALIQTEVSQINVPPTQVEPPYTVSFYDKLGRGQPFEYCMQAPSSGGTCHRWCGRNCCDWRTFQSDPCEPLEVSFPKREGIWHVRVNDFQPGPILSKTFIHDETPPTCSFWRDLDGDGVAESTDQTNIGLIDGLNGKWVNQEIEVNVSCLDMIQPFGTDELRPNPGFCSASSVNSTFRIAVHGEQIEKIVLDKVGNQGTCPAGPAKIDPSLPILNSDLRIEHEGLGLAIENMSVSSSNPTLFRANEGDVKLLVNVRDNPQTSIVGQPVGVSGLSFQPEDPTTLAPEEALEDTGLYTHAKFIQVEDENGLIDPAIQPNLELFDVTPGGSDNYTVDLNVRFNSTDTYPALSQVGLYSVQMFVYDKARNEVVSNKHYIRISPSVVDESKSGILNKVTVLENEFDAADCLEDTNESARIYANGTDICRIEYQLQDEFENDLDGRIVRDISVGGQDVNGTYSLLVNTSDAFYNGLRLEDATNQTLSVTGESSFQVRGLLPSVILETSEKVSEAKKLLLKSRTVSYEFQVDSVDKRGGIVSTTDSIALSSDILLHPWFKTAFTPAQERVLLGQDQSYQVDLSTTDLNNLPDRCTVDITGVPSSGTKFVNVALDPHTLAYPSTPSLNRKYQSFVTRLAASGSGSISPGDFYLLSSINCQIEGQNVVYPGGVVGDLFKTCDDWCTPIVLESFGLQADIEGSALGTVSYTDQTDVKENIREYGTFNKRDVREEITKNAFTMTRSREPLNGPGDLLVSLNDIDFSTQDVLYYKDIDVYLTGGEIDGVGTIIVSDGNLIIEDDLEYANTKSSLGVILVNSEQELYPQNGNIFVKADVQEFVGTYFADGGLQSYILDPLDLQTYVGSKAPALRDYIIELEDLPKLDNSDTVDNPSIIIENPLAKQLLLTGSLLTRNTFGGDNFDPKQDPWGDTSDVDTARLYDLHFIRRYTPHRIVERRHPVTNALIREDNIVLAEEDDAYCVKKGTACETNEHSFVIRPDQKISILAPPGFKAETIIQRR